MSEKKQVLLEKPMTWKNVNYAPGSNTMPADAAAYAERRQFGKITGEGADYTPLSKEEVEERFKAGDESEIVLKSMAFHMRTMFGQKPDAPAAKEDSGKASENGEGGNGNPPDPNAFPEDFPGRAVLEKLGKTYSEVQTMDKDALVALNGIGEKTALEILAYGK